MRICEFRSYEPNINMECKLAMDMDKVNGVFETYDRSGSYLITAIVLKHQTVYVMQTYDQVVEQWKGKTE